MARHVLKSVVFFVLAGTGAFLFNWLMPQGVGWLPAEVEHPLWKPATLDEAHDMFEQGARFLDARHEDEYAADHIWWAMHFTPEKEEALRALIRQAMVSDQQVVVYGKTRSFWPAAIIAQRLHKQGFTEVYVMTASFDEWKQAGYPVTDQRFGP